MRKGVGSLLGFEEPLSQLHLSPSGDGGEVVLAVRTPDRDGVPQGPREIRPHVHPGHPRTLCSHAEGPGTQKLSGPGSAGAQYLSQTSSVGYIFDKWDDSFHVAPFYFQPTGVSR